jgi:hypothetical protein
MFKLSKQASVLVVGYIIFVLAVLVPNKISLTNYDLQTRFQLLLSSIIPVIISVFTVNCLVTGNLVKGCGILSWVNSIVIFLVTIISSVLIFNFINKEKVEINKKVEIKIENENENPKNENNEEFLNF